MNKFNLEDQYQEYLKLVKLNEETMHPAQKIETRRAFFGACGIMLVMLRDDIGGIEDEDEAIRVLEDLRDQVAKFWETSITDDKSKLN